MERQVPRILPNIRDLLHERGIDVSYETVRSWWNRLGPIFAAEIRKKRQVSSSHSPQWKWHRDEVFVRNNGELHYLWRAVDHEGEVLEAFVSKRRARKTAMVFLKKIMKRYGQPQVIVTDRLRSYRATMKVIGNESSQETGHWKNNRCENSHLPFRRREQAMLKFRHPRSLQKFVSIHSSVHNHFNHERHLTSREEFKLQRNATLTEWQQLSAA